MSKLLKIIKTNYYYKLKNGTFKNLYKFKYLYKNPKTLKKKLKKYFYRFKISKNKTAKTYHGKLYKKYSKKSYKKGKGRRKEELPDVLRKIFTRYGSRCDDDAIGEIIRFDQENEEFNSYKEKLNQIYMNNQDIIQQLKEACDNIINIGQDIDSLSLSVSDRRDLRRDLSLFTYYKNLKQKNTKIDAFSKLKKYLEQHNLFSQNKIDELQDPMPRSCLVRRISSIRFNLEVKQKLAFIKFAYPRG